MSLLGDIKRAIFDSWDQTNGGLDVNIQSQTSPPFGYYLMRFIDETLSLSSTASEDATTIILTDASGFTGVDGEHILIYENDHFLQQEVTAGQISGNTITLKTPIDIPFTTGAKVIRGNINLNVDFSVTPEDVQFKILDDSIPIDLNGIILMFESSAEPDDSSFGGIAELSDGVYFRHIDGRRVNLGNYTKNIDFRARGGKVDYTPKAPSSNYATAITFDTEYSFKQILRIDPVEGCSFTAHLRDNLSTLQLFQIAIIGSYTSGEGE